jgi:N-acylneuraminate cytidylyltransferase
MKILCLIPARGGSKGIPQKNIKPLAGKKLIEYSLDIAKAIKGDITLCVSTDDMAIAKSVSDYGVSLPFIRPPEFATDTSSTRDVILHALSYYNEIGVAFDAILLLQPTSPFRKLEHVEGCIELYNTGIDLVVSVNKSKSNPYYNLFEEDSKGFLTHSKKGNFTRRQDCPTVFEVNGAVYVINPLSIVEKDLGKFEKIVKYEMPIINSIDIDDPLDWIIAETLLNNKLV